MKPTDKQIRAYLLSNSENLRARIARNGHCHVYTTRPRGDGGPRPWWMLAGRREDIARDMEHDAIAQICSLWKDGNDSSSEETANARLIAAAPELLAALENLLGYAESHSKAHGITAPGYGMNPVADSLEALVLARAAIAKATAPPSEPDAYCPPCSPVPDYDAAEDGDYSAWLVATKPKAASGKGRSTSFVCHENACFRAGQIVTIQGIEHKIKTVTPTRISRDSYGSEVDWSGFEIGAVRC